MNFRNRAVVRAGAAALLAAGALAAAGAPAYAAGLDIELKLTGTTIAADASGKFASLTLSNVGDEVPEELVLRFDITALDMSKVEFVSSTCGEPQFGEVYCGILEEFIPKRGASVDLDFPLVRKDGATGDAGKLTVTVIAEADPTDSATVDVSVGGNGVDLGVWADDVHAVDEKGNVTDKPVPPGDVAPVIGYVLNQGDATAAGVKVQVKLPEHTSFAEVEEGCAYAADNRTVTCEYEIVTLIPADKDESDDYRLSGKAFWFPVRVAEDAPGPVSLKGGVFSADAMEEVAVERGSIKAQAAPQALPDNVKNLSPNQVADVDPSDNNDEFSVLVAGPGGGAGGGGSLPITGVQAGLIGGVGAAVVIAGGAMFLLARRRRVVLVAPADEKPTA